ncbi:hypothetical protein [Sunxiuqinia indica]|uniref:hypothetical protein n=1 Tax=Sunxiuqinia indica TaxID=2692584 RepID=UPI001357749D|nr:hypothetical protein [Sunxiuqinia indica]
MALGHRLTIEGDNIYGNTTTVKVWLEGYAGPVEERSGTKKMLTVKWGSKSKQELPNIYGAEATVEFYAENDYEFLDLYTANARDVYVEIFKNDTDVLFKGFIEPDKWSEPLISPRYPVSLTAFDGLGLLKDEDFTDDLNEPYSGESTPIEILALILAKTGLSLNINTAVTLRESTQATGADPLTQYKKELLTYEDKSCYEVLEQLFRPFRIMQRNGQWWIISNDQWNKTTVSYYTYTSAGTAAGSGTLNPQTAQEWSFLGIANMDVSPALKQMTIKQDYGYKSNLIENGSFTSLENGNFEDWTFIGTTPQQRIYDDKGNKFIYIPGKEAVPGESWDTYSHTKYGVTDAIRVYATTAIPTLSLSYALMGATGASAFMYFGIELIGDGGTRYVIKPTYNYPFDLDIYYEWAPEPTLKYGIPIDAYVNRFKKSIFDGGGWETEIKRKVITAYPFDEVAEHFKQLDISLKEGIPETGQLRFYLYLADSSAAEVAGSCFRELGLKFADENNEELPTDRELLLTNNPKNNYTPDDLEVLNGDLPDIPNNLIIYQGGFVLTDDTPSALWKLDGVAGTYTYAEIVARLIASSMRQPVQTYDCALLKMLPGTDMVISDPDNSDKLLVEAGITYNDRNQTIEGRYIEVLSVNLAAFTVGEKINYTKSSNANSGSGGQKVVNTDEMVGFITPEFQKVNQPGRLNADYFEGIEDSVTGLVEIHPLTRLIHDNVTDRINPIATGDNSIAIGEGTEAAAFREVAIGSFPTQVAGTADSWVDTDRLVVVGVGEDDLNRADAHTIFKSGYQVATNAIAIADYVHGAELPVDGSLQFKASTAEFQGYHSAAWHHLWTDADFTQADIDNWANVRLDEIQDPAADTLLSMGGNLVEWRFTNPIGGMLINMTGGWSGHVFEVFDNSTVPNGAAGDHLLHMETSRINVLPAHLINSAGGNALRVEGTSQFTGTVTVTGTVTHADATLDTQSATLGQVNNLITAAAHPAASLVSDDTAILSLNESTQELSFVSSNLAKLDATSHNFTGTGSHTFAGELGINTTSPDAPLDVVGTGYPVGLFRRTTTVTGGDLNSTAGIASGYSLRTVTSGDMFDGFGGGVIFSVQDDSSPTGVTQGTLSRIYSRRDGADDRGLLQFFTTGITGNTPTMTLRNSGDVGIGTVTPNTTLDVNGEISKEGTQLLLDAHKSGSLGAAGQFYISNGSTSTPVWTSPGSINISGFNNDAGYLTGYTETDPVWTAEKSNYYTSAQVNALPVSTFTNDAGYITSAPTYTEGTGIDITGSIISMDINGLTAIIDPSTSLDYIPIYDASAGGIRKIAPLYLYSWNLYVDDSNKGTISKSENVNFKAGSGMSLVYSSTNNTITFNASASSYSEGSGIDITGGTISLDIAGLTNTAPTSDAVSLAFYDSFYGTNRRMTLATLGAAIDVNNAFELQGRTVATTAPTSGQVLGWNGTSWTPTTVSGGSGLWQDLTGVIAQADPTDLVRVGTTSAIGTADLQVSGTVALTAGLRFFSLGKWSQIDAISSAGIMRISVNASSEVGTYSEGLRLDGPNARVTCGLEKFKVPVRTSDPSGEVGDIYYNTSTGKFRGYASAGWVNLN